MNTTLQRTLKIWVAFSLIALLPVAVWTIGQREGLLVIWGWFLILFLPGLWHLWRTAQRPVSPQSSNLLLLSRFSWGFLLLVTALLFALPALVKFTGHSPQLLLLRSLLVLIPFELLLLLLIHRTGNSSDDPADVTGEGVALPEETRRQFLEYIRRNRVEEAFLLMDHFLRDRQENQRHYQAVVQLNQQWNETLSESGLGVLTAEEEARRKAVIVRALLRFVQ